MEVTTRKCALLYSESQSSFHHDPPDSKGDSNFRLLERGIPEVMGFAFAQYIHNLNPTGFKLNYTIIKELWDKFTYLEMTEENWWKLDSFLVDSRELITSEIEDSK